MNNNTCCPCCRTILFEKKDLESEEEIDLFDSNSDTSVSSGEQIKKVPLGEMAEALTNAGISFTDMVLLHYYNLDRADDETIEYNYYLEEYIETTINELEKRFQERLLFEKEDIRNNLVEL
jgi:hypothetical protein